MKESRATEVAFSTEREKAQTVPRAAGDHPRPVTNIQWGIYAGAAAVASFLHLFYLFHGGGLWRDEVSSLHLATLPSSAEMWRALDLPAVFPMVLRVWCAAGLGNSDLGLRAFGCIVGLGILGALWLNARVMGFRIPFVSLGLLGANMTLVRSGDSVRAYGLGCLFIALAVGQLWALVVGPNRRRFVLASLAAILSVQCLYQNAFLVAAACAAGCLVCLARRIPRTAGLLFAVGLSAAISLAPYATHLAHSGGAWKVLRVGFNERTFWSNLSEALGSPLLEQRWIWMLLLVFAGGIGIASLDHQDRARQFTRANLALFGSAAACLGVVAFLLFLILAKLPSQAWYYLPLMTFVAVCLDCAFVQWFARRPSWWAAFSALMIALSLPFALSQAVNRQTNIDRIADWLGQHARPNDLIIVYPWYCGVTFNHYYKGTTPWTTLPSLADHRFHRYDLLEKKLAAADPIQDVLERALSTGAAGNAVWIVGRLPPPDLDETEPPVLPPAPGAPTGWFDEPYTYVWGRQTDHFVRARLGRVEAVPVEPQTGVFWYEDSALFRVGGFDLSPIK